jgi:recombination protein RecT
MMKMANENNQQVAVKSKREIATIIESTDYQARIANMLPPDIDRKKFTAVVLRAIQEDPDLRKDNVDKSALLLACQRAAGDGLLPDKREGVIVIRKGKPTWNPMIGGMRKILGKLGYDLRAELVYERDAFDYELGDDPKLSHKPAPLGVDRGKQIGAYAIITHSATGRKYREVMNMTELNAIKAMGAGGGPWGGAFASEMYRKAVGRRCFKQVPIVETPENKDALERLNRVLESDNALFDLGKADTKPSDAAREVQEAVRREQDAAADENQDTGEIEGEAEEVEEGDDAFRGVDDE